MNITPSLLLLQLDYMLFLLFDFNKHMHFASVLNVIVEQSVQGRLALFVPAGFKPRLTKPSFSSITAILFYQ
jgi:hypothetical protein